MPKKVVVLTDCIDVAWQEIRGSIYSNAKNYDVIIEPVVPVASYSIENVNFLVRLIAEIYPPETIICVIVNPLKKRTERIIGTTKKKKLYFEGTNTGAFTWLEEDFGIDEVYELFDPGFVPFGGKYVHAPAVGKLASGTNLKELGNPFDKDKIRHIKMEIGTVIHIDNFGNLKLYHKFDDKPKNGDKYIITLNDEDIKVTYNERMMEKNDNEIIIYPGSSFNFTEVGIVRGHFANLYNVKNGDVIKIRKED